MTAREHNHYFKFVEGLRYVDVYRVLQLFGVVDPCLQHAVKKLLVAGGRGAGKDIARDVKEAIDTLTRWQEMQAEALKIDRRVSDVETALERRSGSGPYVDPSSIPVGQATPLPDPGAGFTEGGFVPAVHCSVCERKVSSYSTCQVPDCPQASGRGVVRL